MEMSTTVAFGTGWQISSKQTVSVAAYPATHELPEQEINIIRAAFAQAHPIVARVRVDPANSAIWEWLEVGLVVTLALSGFVSILLFLSGAGKI